MPPDLQAERAALVRVQRQTAELDLAVKRKQLVTVDEGLTILIGPNNGGKSTIVESLRAVASTGVGRTGLEAARS